MYVYINVSRNKCEMAEGKQVYLFMYLFIYLSERNYTLALIFLNCKLTLPDWL
jgi:hypothetical protein